MFPRSAIRGLSSKFTAVRAAAKPVTKHRLVGRVSLPAAASTAMSSSSFSTSTSTANNERLVVNPDMFCRQCEQTKDHFACTTVGVCGKTAETSAMQDALMQLIKSVSLWANAARATDLATEDLHAANVWTIRAAFSTLTNVNFSEERIADYIQEGMAIKKDLESAVLPESAPTGDLASVDLMGMGLEELEAFGHSVSLPARQEAMEDADCFSLNEIGTYGVKGASAYAAHCYQLGKMDEEVMADIHQVFAKLGSDEADMEGLLANAMKVGEINGKILAMLDDAHATFFGEPEPTQVKTTVTEGKAILISGHDLKDLETLLQQTEGKDVNVYTHGEMLPAHAYPELKKYSHLKGNYGTAWQNQKFEFASFPGPIVVTTNCILEPRRAYRNRLYTMNEVGVDGVAHIGEDRDFSVVIDQALHMKGFPRTIEPAQYHTVGFNHRAVLPLANQIIEAVQTGVLSRIVLIGGCDGSQWDRSYFTDLAEELPEDTLILTLGCAKNRIIHSEKLLGATLSNGMPRVLDMGQCNDSYSAVVVATELAKALDCGVNDLPLSLALSHLEQKAAAVLLTLLQMGVKNIRLGPSLPSYVTPNVLDVLVGNFNLMPTTNAKSDIEQIMMGK
mmetsp:Transcript_5084/g.12132  ORF Transcript_5084/g.12132 Transcript_5084/m.12132 type:complete len:619 (+) Transcript_5084:69-1925(+)|eukprot:CAMPEP_0113608088 /NCGR_PEP_ID=MMETSP0017_2-20120614/3732_1 /TAXON_ID=2856 /ORGANISM="Cylindrotheca closterium" /LENGTH=618 /DNA_ID=CAMNT_0000516737 /DNA_START=8 /DNA_END=1864 /DNA_ORIENTATION=+ /assembly_acc=CAM_ASM_000147